MQMTRHPRTSALSPVLDEMLRLHNRLQPHLLRYRQLMSDDQDYTDRVCILHYFSEKATLCLFCIVAQLYTVIIRYKCALLTDVLEPTDLGLGLVEGILSVFTLLCLYRVSWFVLWYLLYFCVIYSCLF